MSTPVPDSLEKKTWETMTARERNEWVALWGMGWTSPHLQVDVVPPFPLGDREWSYRNPPPEVDEWRSNYHWREPSGACWGSPPKYTSDVAADYEVLKRVRETWKPNAFIEYSVRLQEMLTKRLSSERPLCGAMMFYELGDYSHAAYLALTAE